MARIGIIGLGNWGTALAKVWCDDGHNVMGWTIEQEVYESIMTENINKKYLPQIKIPDLQATMQIEDITTDCEIIVLAVPSGIILGVVDQMPQSPSCVNRFHFRCRRLPDGHMQCCKIPNA